MVTAKCIGLSLCLLSLGTTLNGVVAQYTKEDKKIFDGLIDVSFTKSFLASKERKEKRIEDLQQLATLMVRRLINIMDGAGLNKEYNTHSVLETMRPIVSDLTEKKELFGASRFAVAGFEKNFEDSMEAIFKNKVNELEARPTEKPYAELKNLLSSYKLRAERAKIPFTLLSFENFINYDFKALADKKAVKDTFEPYLRLKRVLRPTKEETIKILKESLEQFNTNYKEVISALKKLTTDVILPDTMSLDWKLFKKQQPA